MKETFKLRDSRYTHLVGRRVWHPFRREELPIIADEQVDPDFGTGAVKITPAHDINDFEMGARHGLKHLNLLNVDGTMNSVAGEFAGLHRCVMRRAFPGIKLTWQERCEIDHNRRN